MSERSVVYRTEELFVGDTVPDLLVGLSGEAEVYAYMMSTPDPK